MKKTYGILLGFAGLMLLDCILSYAMPIDFTYSRMSIVWHFFLSGLLIFVCDKPLLTRLLCGIAGGLAYDGLITGTFPFCTFLFALLAVLSGLFPRFFASTERRSIYTVFLIFLSDLLPFMYQRSSGQLNISVASWLYHMELLTIIFSGLIVIGVLYLDLVMSRYYLLQSRLDGTGTVQAYAPGRRVANANHPEQTKPAAGKARRR